MKLVLATALVALIAFATGCSMQHRSDGYTCATTSDCAEFPGRVCDNGYCVVGSVVVDAPHVDAPKPPGDSGNGCPPGCTTCNTTQKTCTINCQTANCTNTVSCPAGYKCDIQCNTDNSCRNGVNCTLSASCTVECSGKGSCQNVACGAGPCAVGCSGPGSCRGVSCGNSCACDVVCTGNQSCTDTLQCKSLACRAQTGLGCTSVPAYCHSCN